MSTKTHVLSLFATQPLLSLDEAFASTPQKITTPDLNRRYVDPLDHLFKTPLFFVCQNNRGASHADVLERVRWMVTVCGADIDKQCTNRFQTPLYPAIAFKMVDVVRFFLEQGVSRTHTDSSGNTPLFFAVKVGSVDIVRLLLNAGVNPFIRNEAGHIAYDYISPLSPHPDRMKKVFKDFMKSKKGHQHEIRELRFLLEVQKVKSNALREVNCATKDFLDASWDLLLKADRYADENEERIFELEKQLYYTKMDLAATGDRDATNAESESETESDSEEEEQEEEGEEEQEEEEAVGEEEEEELVGEGVEKDDEEDEGEGPSPEELARNRRLMFENAIGEITKKWRGERVSRAAFYKFLQDEERASGEEQPSGGE